MFNICVSVSWIVFEIRFQRLNMNPAAEHTISVAEYMISAADNVHPATEHINPAAEHHFRELCLIFMFVQNIVSRIMFELRVQRLADV